jgi:cell division protein FtsB
MGWFTKKADPISDRARALNDEIAALEEQIKRLDAQLSAAPPPPKLRSTAMPHGAATVVHQPTAPTVNSSAAAPQEPIFENVGQDRLKSRAEPDTLPEHFNELGIRKYDLAAVLRRAKNHLRGPPTANPRLVNYLAAGSIQGLRPMRYEKRVARNRFLTSAIVLFFFLVGILAWFRLRR